MAGKRLITIHISPFSIHILEGKLDGGNLILYNSANIYNIGKYFEGERVKGLRELVRGIVEEIKGRGFRGKEVSIIYDNGVEVEFFLNEKSYKILFNKL